MHRVSPSTDFTCAIRRAGQGIAIATMVAMAYSPKSQAEETNDIATGESSGRMIGASAELSTQHADSRHVTHVPEFSAAILGLLGTLLLLRRRRI